MVEEGEEGGREGEKCTLLSFRVRECSVEASLTGVGITSSVQLDPINSITALSLECSWIGYRIIIVIGFVVEDSSKNRGCF